MNQLNNGIPIQSFEGDSSDMELRFLEKYLVCLSKLGSVCEELQSRYCLSILSTRISGKGINTTLS